MKNSIVRNGMAVVCLFASSVSMAQPAPAPVEFKVNPTSLRVQVLGHNLSLVNEFFKVHDAKDHLRLARDSLFPSLALGASVLSGPKFVLSSVSSLLPFLFPSNWFNMAEEKHLYQAELVSYRILELNTYSSALSLYYTVVSAEELMKIYQKQYDDLHQIAEILRSQADHGIGSEDDALQAEAAASTANANISNAQNVIDANVAAFRNLLSLPETTVPVFEIVDAPVSVWENRDIMEAVKESQKVAPEIAQIRFMEAAARNAKWSTVFGFLGAGSLGAQSSPSSPDSGFGAIHGSGTATLGIGQVDTIRLANRNIKEIQFQETMLLQQDTQVLEASIKGVTDMVNAYKLFADSEKRMETVYADNLTYYNHGLEGLNDLLLIDTQLVNAMIAKVNAQEMLNQLRLTLHRTMITDEFAKVVGCTQPIESTGRHARKMKLDEACREGSPTPAL